MSEEDNLLLTRIDEVLHYLWDPIGVCDIPAARDEYSSYAGVIFSMMKRGASIENLREYLVDIRVVHMGIGERDYALKEDEVVEVLDNWRANILGNNGIVC